VLREILEAFRSSGRDLCAEEVAARLGSSIPLTAAKLEHLQKMGYLQAYTSRSVCEACPLWTSCAVPPRPRRLYNLRRDRFEEPTGEAT
jgi:hypothetical protein